MRNLKEVKKESKLIRNGNDFHLTGWRGWWSRMEAEGRREVIKWQKEEQERERSRR